MLTSQASICFADGETGKITVTLEDKYKNKLDGVKVNICQVAELSGMGYFPTADFEDSGISLSGIINDPSELTAKTLVAYIRKNGISSLSAISEEGKTEFLQLDLGVWVVYPEENGKYVFNPFIVLLPFANEGVLEYEVMSSPKVDDSRPDEISIYVLKRWDDKNNGAGKRPDFVTVELLDGDRVVATVDLSEANAWSHTFENVKKDGNYSVREKKVENYKTAYSGDAVNGFIVINTYDERLPQTGQNWLPVIILAVAGGVFLLLGIFELGARKNGKK